jgi:hemerythrin-like domain-containing protein
MDDHRLMAEACLALRRLVNSSIESGPRSDTHADLSLFVQFFQDYVTNHHKKEETILFPAIIPYGMKEVVEVLHTDHVQLNEFLTELQTQCINGNDFEKIHKAALAYSELMRRHVHYENHGLLPNATTVLNDDLLDELGDLFATCDIEWIDKHGGGENSQTLIKDIRKLIEKYGLDDDD